MCNPLDVVKTGLNVGGQLLGAKSEADARRGAYQDAINRSRELMQTGEKGFLESTSEAPPELQALEKDIQGKGTQTMQDAAGQQRVNMYQQGVRGGQAATLANRGTGQIAQDVQSDINRLKAEDAQRRQGQKAAYYSATAGRGQQALVGAPAM